MSKSVAVYDAVVFDSTDHSTSNFATLVSDPAGDYDTFYCVLARQSDGREVRVSPLFKSLESMSPRLRQFGRRRVNGAAYRKSLTYGTVLHYHRDSTVLQRRALDTATSVRVAKVMLTVSF